MKHSRLKKGMVVDCLERERLRKTLSTVHKEHSRIQDRMRKVLKRTGSFGRDVFEFKKIGDRLTRATRLYGQHVAQHRCVYAKALALKKKPKSKRRGK